MDYKNLIRELSTSQGEKSLEIMKELGDFLKKASPGQKTTFNSECINAIPKANEKRKGSLSFLIALCNVNKKIIIDLLKDESPIIREQTIKGLLYKGEEYLSEFKKRLKEENLYRIKKWIIIAIGNIETKEAIKILEETEVEPQIFSTKEKIISKFKEHKKYDQEINGKSGEMLVQVPSGVEEEFLKAYQLQGTKFGDGIIQLNSNFEFNHFSENRSIFYYGIFIGHIKDIKSVLKKRFEKEEEYCIKYTNEIKGEKERLSEFQAELSKNNWKYNPNSNIILRLLNEEEAMLLLKPEIKEKLQDLPASINRVVANAVGLIAHNEHGNAKLILDPCCGASTLLLEYSKIELLGQKIEGQKKYIGIDKDANAIKKSKINCLEYKQTINYYEKKFEEVLLVKAPDLVLSNPPFDNRVKGEFDHNKFLKFLDKNTTKDATIIIYTVRKEDIREASENNNLSIKKEIKLKLKKINPSIFIIKKK